MVHTNQNLSLSPSTVASEFSEFVVLVAPELHPAKSLYTEEQWKKLSRMFDWDGNGYITTVELTRMIKEADKLGYLPPICFNGVRSVPICIAVKRSTSDNESS